MVSVSDPLMEAIAFMTDWRRVWPFRCQASMREFGAQEDACFELFVNPRISSYAVNDLSSGETWNYDDYSRTLVTHRQRFNIGPEFLNHETRPVRLAFPLTLPIWGRKHDQYRMHSAVDGSENIRVLVCELNGTTPVGHVIVSRKWRMVTNLDLPVFGLDYREIEIYQGPISST